MTEQSPRQSIPWALISCVLFLGAMIGSCNGYQQFLVTKEQARLKLDEQKQMAIEKLKQEERQAREKQINATLSTEVKGRVTKYEQCLHSRPRVSNDPIFDVKGVEHWMHYCLSGKPMPPSNDQITSSTNGQRDESLR